MSLRDRSRSRAPRASRVVPFLVVAASSVLAAGCTLALSYPAVTSERGEIGCSNALDDDLDGATDCGDDECASAEVCREVSEIACGDRRDNDLDGLVDCLDDGCRGATVCQESDEASCADGLDDDEDGDVDCDDDGCVAADVCQESDVAACQDDLDNDRDGRVDCFDEGCDGLCPEADFIFCTDERDNDGDGLVDARDPRCWPFRRIQVERCGSSDATNLVERLDDPVAFAERFYAVGGDATIVGTPDRLNALLVASDPGRVDLTTVGTRATFRGAYRGLDFSALVSVEAPGSLVRIGFAPDELAPIGAARLVSGSGDLTAIQIADRDTAQFDGTTGATRVIPWTGHGMQRITIREVDGALQATIAPVPGLGTGVTASFAPVPLGDLLDEATPAFRIVIDSLGVVLVRDVRLTLRPFDPCGVTVPQMPPGGRVGTPDGVFSMGEGVSLARGDGVLCAMVAGCELAGSGLQPIRRAYRSDDDGVTWEPGEAAFPDPFVRGDGRRGLSVAWDPTDHVFRALATGGLRAGGTSFALTTASSADCRTWTAGASLDVTFSPRDIAAQGCGALAAGLVRPSYVIRRVGDSQQHEIYWTTSTSPRDTLTLVRVVSPDGVLFGPLTDVAIFDPADLPGEPVLVSSFGATDLVVTSALGSREARSGVAIRVVEDDLRFTRIPLALTASATPGTFDRFQIVSGAIAPTEAGLVLLYGGAGDFRFDPFTQVEGGFSAGTANLALIQFTSRL